MVISLRPTHLHMAIIKNKPNHDDPPNVGLLGPFLFNAMEGVLQSKNPEDKTNNKGFNLVSLFNGISTFVGYLMPN